MKKGTSKFRWFVWFCFEWVVLVVFSALVNPSRLAQAFVAVFMLFVVAALFLWYKMEMKKRDQDEVGKGSSGADTGTEGHDNRYGDH